MRNLEERRPWLDFVGVTDAEWEAERSAIERAGWISAAPPPKRRWIPVVYAIEDADGFVKVGSTLVLKDRIKKLGWALGAPVRLWGYIYGSIDNEVALHDRLAPWRVIRSDLNPHACPTEWYRNAPEFRLTLARYVGIFDDQFQMAQDD